MHTWLIRSDRHPQSDLLPDVNQLIELMFESCGKPKQQCGKPVREGAFQAGAIWDQKKITIINYKPSYCTSETMIALSAVKELLAKSRLMLERLQLAKDELAIKRPEMIEVCHSNQDGTFDIKQEKKLSEVEIFIGLLHRWRSKKICEGNWTITVCMAFLKELVSDPYRMASLIALSCCTLPAAMKMPSAHQEK